MATEADLLGRYRAQIGRARDLLRPARAALDEVTEPRYGNPKYPDLMAEIDTWLAEVE